MSDELTMPRFASEDEEADWWYDNREALAERFEKAYREGRVEVNGLKRRVAALRGVPLVDLSTEDVPAAYALADRKGMELISYLRLLMHEALEREMKIAS